jgi:hypothetical protein
MPLLVRDSNISSQRSTPLSHAVIGNRREHPLARARRTRREVDAVLAALPPHPPFALPVIVEFTRTGWNALDPDGLVAALKAPVDAVARWLGADDRDRRLFWRFGQTITREKRPAKVRRGTQPRTEAAAFLRLTIGPWTAADGLDPLRVLPAPKTGQRARHGPGNGKEGDDNG